MEDHIRFDAEDSALLLLDQRKLPLVEETFVCRTVEEVVYALQTMVVRGAPAIGVTAAYGCRIALGQAMAAGAYWSQELERLLTLLAQARPTAVNLFWALERMDEGMKTTEGETPEDRLRFLEALACRMEHEDRAVNQALGALGASLLPEEGMVLTHCNAGALATGGHGTALGIVRSARAQGKRLKIFADETRPVLQGARLTSWELSQEGMDVTVICDGMAAALLARHPISAVIVGADRIAANGDVANKIGTYGLAVVARYHGVPFYVAAPRSTLDLQTATGADIPIEIRKDDEIRRWGETVTVAPEASVWNPAFDVTPGALVSAVVTEVGILRPPYARTLRDAGAIPFDPDHPFPKGESFTAPA